MAKKRISLFTPLHPENTIFQSGDERHDKLEAVRKLKSLSRGVTGFTLMELVVAVVIVGILATLGIAQFDGAVWKSKLNEVYTNTLLIAKAQRTYRLVHGNWAVCDMGANGGRGCELGNSVTPPTQIQAMLKISLPNSASFRYLVYPSAAGPGVGVTSIYFAQPGHNWSWAYDYVARAWWHYCVAGGGCSGSVDRYFVPKAIE